MSIYLIGCTHFGHENIINLCDRPFSSVDEMDEVLIENWNKAVSAEDTVYHLGDFAYKGPPGSQYIERLNGNIVTIQGNHDPNDWGASYLKLKANGKNCILFHYPIEEWDGWYRGDFHFHCHTHKKEFVSARRRGNVGADAVGFTPILLEEAIERLRKAHPQ